MIEAAEGLRRLNDTVLLLSWRRWRLRRALQMRSSPSELEDGTVTGAPEVSQNTRLVSNLHL